jgi:hypothetical protein
MSGGGGEEEEKEAGGRGRAEALGVPVPGVGAGPASGAEDAPLLRGPQNTAGHRKSRSAGKGKGASSSRS